MLNEVKVGIFVLAGLILCAISLFILGDYSFKHYYNIYADFADVSGLPDKAMVKLSGVEVGKIKRIYLDNDRVVVEMAIEEGTDIYEGARFQVGATSVIGSKFLQIDQGDPKLGIIKPGERIKGWDAPALDKAVSDALAGFKDLINDVRGQGDFAKNLQDIMTNVREITVNINQLVAASQPHARNTVEQLDKLTARLNDMMEKADRIIAKIDNGEGLAGTLISDQSMKKDVTDTLNNLKDATASVKKVMDKVSETHTYIKWDYRYNPVAGTGLSDVGLQIYPNEKRYYYVGGANIINEKDSYKRTEYQRLNTITGLLGWKIGAFDVYGGVLRGTGGAGVAWKPFDSSKHDILKLYAEGSDFSRDRDIFGRHFDNPQIDIGADVEINKYFSAGLRVSDIAEAARLNYTTHIRFEDKDLSSLFGIASVGAALK